MWPLLRAELAYSRRFLAAAWGIALGVALLINGLAFLQGAVEPDAIAFLPGIFLVVASMIAGFILQGARAEERRLRLLLTSPRSPLQVALVIVAVPAAVMAIGVAAAAAAVVLAELALGPQRGASPAVPAVIGMHLLAALQLGLLGGEAAAAWGQRRRRAALLAWLLFIALLPLVGVVDISSDDELVGRIAALPAAAAAAAAAVALFVRRTDFTR